MFGCDTDPDESIIMTRMMLFWRDVLLGVGYRAGGDPDQKRCGNYTHTHT